MEPHVGRPRRASTCSPSRCATPTARPPTRASTALPVPGPVPGDGDVRRRHAQRAADPLPGVGPRADDRHGHRRTGKPVALTRKRSTFGRDGLNLAALKDMTEGKADTPRRFFETREPVRVHVQLGLRLAQGDGVLLVGPDARPSPRPRPPAAHARRRRQRVARLPVRAAAPARRVRSERPAAELEQPVGARASSTATARRAGRCTASSCSTGSRGGCGSPTTSSVMNRAATEDVRSLVWPVVEPGARPAVRRRPRSLATLVRVLDDWVARRRPAARCRRRRRATTTPARRSWTRSGARSPTR